MFKLRNLDCVPRCLAAKLHGGFGDVLLVDLADRIAFLDRQAVAIADVTLEDEDVTVHVSAHLEPGFDGPLVIAHAEARCIVQLNTIFVTCRGDVCRDIQAGTLVKLHVAARMAWAGVGVDFLLVGEFVVIGIDQPRI